MITKVYHQLKFLSGIKGLRRGKQDVTVLVIHQLQKVMKLLKKLSTLIKKIIILAQKQLLS